MTIGLLVVLIIIGLLCILILPQALIWSLNILFGLGIAITFKTWLAALFLIFLLGNYGNKSSK